VKTFKRDDEYWIKDGDEEYGPYDTKKEADEDRIGMQRFIKYEDEPGFVTIETQTSEFVD